MIENIPNCSYLGRSKVIEKNYAKTCIIKNSNFDIQFSKLLTLHATSVVSSLEFSSSSKQFISY